MSRVIKPLVAKLSRLNVWLMNFQVFSCFVLMFMFELEFCNEWNDLVGFFQDFIYFICIRYKD
jgi:hypothetical protein